MKNTWIILFAFVLLFGCRQNESKTGDFAGMEQPEPAMDARDDFSGEPSQPSETMEVKPETIQKKIIKDGRLGIKVDDLEETKTRIDTLVAQYQGYYSNESLTNTDFESAYNLKIRVPAHNFEAFIEGVESGEGEIVFKNIDARDVTEEFIDLETRLANKRNYLKQYNDLLKQAKSVKEILEIQEKTRVIEEEIDSVEGRLKYLADQVAFSTLDLTVTKEKGFVFRNENRRDFGERLKFSLSRGWFGFIDFLLFLLKLWPLWLILALLYPLWRRFRLKRRRKTS